MVDREKVIRGLECCVRDVRGKAIRPCDDCPYDNDGLEKPCQMGLMTDALDLLKDQEARVMTVEEINKRAESLDPDPVFVQWRETGGTAWVTRSINIIAGMVNAGNRSVRAWTSRPSPEQMRDTPWKGESV